MPISHLPTNGVLDLMARVLIADYPFPHRMKLEIRLGDRDLLSPSDDDYVQTRPVETENVFIHPKRSDERSKLFRHDIALVKLDPPVQLSRAVRPICLPESASEDPDEFQGNLVRFTGIG